MGESSLHTFRASDGYHFYFRHYSTTGAMKARIVFVHGIRSHGGWYERSCAAFAATGFDVYCLDRRGAGLNTAHRGDCPSFRRLLDDVAEFIQNLRADHAGWPIYVAGISWGGKLAAGLPYRKPGLVDGVVMLCPGLVPKVTPPLLRRMRIALARVFRPDRMFPIPLNEPELFTASPQWQQYIAEEPHGLRQATARFLFSSFSFDIYLRRAVKRVRVPTLLILSEHDLIIDNRQTRLLAGRFDTPVSIIDYPQAHHTLEFEPQNHPWIADVASWIANRVGLPTRQ